ncbi:alpha/beta hydrolase [uncultured Leifsonia sp.]|uniref:alpha/beta hydrolase n=1 Tax=uncultured Leifsonia sp. TaxID=340359 RepID=UPI0025FE07F1|nr:alpha/beta hydrolase [uncultured Leifsonia sp.]
MGFETDPTPGDLQLVEALVSHLDTWSGRLEVQSKAARKVLDTNLGPASWSGLAAQVFSDRLRALSAAALKAAEQHNAGAVAAKAWSMALEYAQREADRALLDAEDAVADLETAEALVATLGAEQAALSAALRALEKAYNSREKPPPGSSAPAHVDVTRARRQEQDGSEKLATARLTIRDAQERLDDAKRRAERAKQDYDAAEGAFARKLDDALHGALAPTPQPELTAFALIVGKLSGISVTASVNASLMDTLKRLTPEELAVLLAEDPDLAQEFWKHPPSPDTVAKWWAGLGEETREALQTAAPGVLGNLAGLPYGVRHRCNLDVYLRLKDSAGHTPEQQKVLDALNKVLSDPLASLVCFNLDAQVPMVAVGYGDLDTADTVTWAAPGMNSDAADATESWSRAAQNLYREQKRLDADRSHAVVGWLGYDTPDLVSVNTPALAQDGSWRFANELDGTHATRAAHPSVPFPYVAVVAHSYGTTTAADALTHVKHTVDSFTMLGSAGIDTQVVSSLSDLHVKQAGGRPSIYTTAAELDFLAPFGSAMGGRAEPNPEALTNLGTAVAMPLKGVLNQPQSMGGAQSFSAEGAVLPNGEVLKQTKGHSTVGEHIDGLNPLNGIAPEGFGYLDEGTEALRNTGFTTMGLSRSVVGGLKATR